MLCAPLQINIVLDYVDGGALSDLLQQVGGWGVPAGAAVQQPRGHPAPSLPSHHHPCLLPMPLLVLMAQQLPLAMPSVKAQQLQQQPQSVHATVHSSMHRTHALQ
jgi:hypothetical protein